MRNKKNLATCQVCGRRDLSKNISHDGYCRDCREERDHYYEQEYRSVAAMRFRNPLTTWK